jgi:hypothetical protein
METAQKVDKAEVEEEWRALLFGVRRSVRYHMRRCRFFELFHSFTNVIGVIAGSSAAVTAFAELPHQEWRVLGPVIAGAIVAIASTVDLVVGTAAAARLHNDLAKQFVELEKEMTLAGEPTEERLRKLIAKRLTIEAQEPPVMRTLDRLCHNELLRAMGYPDTEHVKIPRYQRWLAQLISFEPSRQSRPTN